MKREFNAEVKNGGLRIFLDGNNYHCDLSNLYLSDNPIKKALEFNFENDVYEELDELQQFEYDKVNNEIKENWGGEKEILEVPQFKGTMNQLNDLCNIIKYNK